MKALAIGLLLTFAVTASAHDIVVFGKGRTLVLGSDAPPPADAADRTFLAAFTHDLARSIAFGSPAKLDAPPDWGRTVAGAGGTIAYPASYPRGFVVRVSLSGLLPAHRYILTLNGNPTLPGNDRLVDPVPGNPKERYFDFQTVTTDDQGRYEATFAIRLEAGPYGARFYVKDTDDFKIVLYHDYFNFAVR